MTFQSILFKNVADRDLAEQVVPPGFFVDLNLDQIVTVVTAKKEEYALKPFFYLPLHDVDAITYRHEIMRDLQDARLFATITSFSARMRTMRRHLDLAGKLSYVRQKERWFLDAVDSYCDAVSQLVGDLSREQFTSRGLLSFREYITEYAASESFGSLREQTKKLKNDLASIRYCLFIDGLTVHAGRYADEPDYTAEIEATFERFKQGDVSRYPFEFSEEPGMNRIEAMVFDLVVKRYPDIFFALEQYCSVHKEFQYPTIVTFDREIQFYIAWLEYIAPLREAGLNFCYPRISSVSKEIHSLGGFDLALAAKLRAEQSLLVCNDFRLAGPERVIVVTGPNQGGKTTFARTFGQLHYLAGLGCPVPGAEAQLFLFDRRFTHFEREENTATSAASCRTTLSGSTPSWNGPRLRVSSSSTRSSPPPRFRTQRSSAGRSPQGLWSWTCCASG
jgi:hypothetical protein